MAAAVSQSPRLSEERARSKPAERLEGEVLLVRLGALDRPYAREELERLWRRGRFPLTNDSTEWEAYIGDQGCIVISVAPSATG